MGSRLGRLGGCLIAAIAVLQRAVATMRSWCCCVGWGRAAARWPLDFGDVDWRAGEVVIRGEGSGIDRGSRLSGVHREPEPALDLLAAA